ncbi:hypothetical protein ACQY0O_007483 [Thecaphora frezii]
MDALSVAPAIATHHSSPSTAPAGVTHTTTAATAPVDSANATAAAATAAARLITDRFINQTVVVHIPDGRAFRGTLLCIDNSVNIILANTFELRSTAASDGAHVHEPSQATDWDTTFHSSPRSGVTERNVGMIMVPGNHVVRFEVEQFPGSGIRDAPPSTPSLATHMTAAGWPEDPHLYV